MRVYLLIPLALLLSCRSVKNSNTPQSNDQLLSDVKILSSDDYQGRRTGTKGAEMSRSYISGRLKNLGLKSFKGYLNYEQPFKAKEKNGSLSDAKNLIAYIPGKSDQVIVLSAHYDHLGVIKNEIFNGADDNASGVAGLLKIAAWYAKSKPNNTLVFAFFDAGELEWQGSKYFVNNAPVSLDKILLDVNLDMISHNEQNILYVAGSLKNPQLKPYITHTNQELKIRFGHDNPKQSVEDWTNQSDQGAFNAKKIPFLYFGVEDHKDYHKESDEYQNINPDFLISSSNAILEIVDNIDKQRDIQAIYKQNLQMKKQ
ncbi:MAG: M28 family peptidase [Pedobacter sp.]|nr:MAG: M28 family peptidase [Pedobacter sp.]